MLSSEHELQLAAVPNHRDLLSHLACVVPDKLPEGFWPTRFVIPQSNHRDYRCEVGGLSGVEWTNRAEPDSIFRFVKRKAENTNSFNVVLLIPTGVGAEVGGHAGDATPVARMLGAICDRVILHPNVVNASDLNEMPANALYVEGSVITRFMMGTVGLQPVRSNRVLAIIDAHKDQRFVDRAVNAISGARGSFGFNCPEVVCLEPPILLRARFSPSGRAAGRVEELDGLCKVLDEREGQFDAVAISSVINVPHEYHLGYYDARGAMINPWGGVEAMLTHAISSLYNVPTAHSPMWESQAIADLHPGMVEPRMAAESVSMTFLHCILKGLAHSPRIIADPRGINQHGVLNASDVSCMVIPDGCLGLPTLAALEQGIPVIAVKENRNVMKNDLRKLPWAPGQFIQVANYWEAAGVMASMRAGIAPETARRPLADTVVTTVRIGQRQEQATVPSKSNGKQVAAAPEASVPNKSNGKRVPVMAEATK